MDVVVKEYVDESVKLEVVMSKEEFKELRNDMTLESREGSLAKHVANQMWMTTV